MNESVIIGYDDDAGDVDAVVVVDETQERMDVGVGVAGGQFGRQLTDNFPRRFDGEKILPFALAGEVFLLLEAAARLDHYFHLQRCNMSIMNQFINHNNQADFNQM